MVDVDEQAAPTLPAAENALGDLLRPTDLDTAERHYRTCVERWPTAAACLMGLARTRGARGECGAYFDLMKRVVLITPDDWLARRRLLESMLAVGRTEGEVRAEVQTQTELFGKLSEGVRLRADLERALRFGAFDDAGADLARYQAQLSEHGIPTIVFVTARLARVMLGDATPSATALARETVRLRKRYQLLKQQLRAQARDAGLLGDPP